MLSTNFSKNLNKEQLLLEYPRPNLQRKSYINLNGYWNYSFTNSNELPIRYDGKILVPFSPESELSGVKRCLHPNEYLWYNKNFDSSYVENNKRLILHFGAVDQYAEVYINTQKVFSHMGGYLPFSVDITDYLIVGTNTLHVMVLDVTDTSYHARGKQKLKPSGMFYTAQSGIWQTVWMECVPYHYVKTLSITPLYDKNSVHLKLTMNTRSDSNTATIIPTQNIIRVYDNKTLVVSSQFNSNLEATIAIPDMKSWLPENPFLYNLTIEFEEDSIISYFAMRKFSVNQDKTGVMRLFLNNNPYFHNGLLDQGYWPESLYTPPSDEAMIFDITTAKKLGFNTLRKHAKIEPLRWYYHCDRIGMLVWQDMVNGGSSYRTWFVTYFPTIFPRISKLIKDSKYSLFSRSDEAGRQEFMQDTKSTIDFLYNSPCVAMWVIFNEAWGQFDTKEVTEYVRSLDPTRTIDSTSGWFDQNTGDMRSLHIYFTPLRFRKATKTVVLSEFGGYALSLTGHVYSNKIYGYRVYKTSEQLTNSYKKLYSKKIIPGLKNGLSATIYTQLSDIEEEINGILTYDRKIIKLNTNCIKQINKELLLTFQTLTKVSR